MIKIIIEVKETGMEGDIEIQGNSIKIKPTKREISYSSLLNESIMLSVRTIGDACGEGSVMVEGFNKELFEKLVEKILNRR